MSLRAFARIGSAISVTAEVRLGDQISVNSNVIIGKSVEDSDDKVDASLSGNQKFVAAHTTYTERIMVKDATKSGAGNTPYLKFESTKIVGYAPGATGSSGKVITLEDTGGTLHGVWVSDAALTSSDRRLKTSIEPLMKTLVSEARDRRGEDKDGEWTIDRKPTGQPINWLLRELRPVSFRLKRGPEAKYLKFGFIAQELESVLPNLVRTVGEQETKAVAHQDLIAVLTLALQTLQNELEEHRKTVVEQNERLARLERAVFASQSGGMQV